jgi:hypothetical protein
MNPNAFLLLNLALAFYGVGAIWAHEVDIFRSWQLLDPAAFRRVQGAHWRKLRYWVFPPLVVTFAGAIALLWYHPASSPRWMIWFAFSCLVASHVLTATTWGRWQGMLSRDERGPASPYLRKILATHWIRTLLINVYGFILLAWAVRTLA